jgi:hypothetical protein
MKALLAFLILLAVSPAYATTPGTGFAVGFGDGLSGIDFSDGTTRTNVGTIFQNLDVGLHLDDFAFLFTGDFMDIQGSLDDYVANGGFKVKWYFLEDFSLTYTMGFSRFQRSNLAADITTLTIQTGGYVGGYVGWDVYASQGNGPFRLSINVGMRRFDYGAQEIRQGSVVSDTDLAVPVVGVDFSLFVGLAWYF